MSEKESTAKKIRNIRRQNRKKYTAEEKIRVELKGFRGDESIAPAKHRDAVNCVVGKASANRCAPNGARNLWRLGSSVGQQDIGWG